MSFSFDYPEGATSIEDISDLKIPWVKNQSDLNRVEAENIANALSKYLTKPVKLPATWFNVTFLINIHKTMFCDVWDWAGIFRKTQTYPGVKPFLIPSTLGELCSDVQNWCSLECDLTFVEQAARIHHRLVFIHPFMNGNGRFSRLVADRYLKGWHCTPPKWPTDLQEDGKLRKLYIDSLKSADNGDYEQLIEYMNLLGAKDPALSELLGHNFFNKNLKRGHLIQIIKTHLKHGSPVNETVNNGHHPLQLSIKNGSEELSKLFISSGADIHSRDRSGLTAFELSIAKNQLSTAKSLCDQGYPYHPRMPTPPKLIRHHHNLQKFDKLYF